VPDFLELVLERKRIITFTERLFSR